MHPPGAPIWRAADSEPATSRFRALGPPRGPLSWAEFESARNIDAGCIPRELRGPIFQAGPGPAQFKFRMPEAILH
eukprot:539802-Alexandrium_andersonii.AAC.1